ncbi:MAG: hypothetical protein COB67_08410 [SAR324 cluster bacterium]|uniref:Response regulatory domain-containing protein n=1 Tax=SAR324 cluster bacterium TaxID=2024889 RepID=A0A2A4T1G1_9DELT|nr:MAG: hypothetical protein COB67_08410 [SAR324 cluster bacterium]
MNSIHLTMLLVDDEALIREVTREMLEDHIAEYIEAENGQEALDLLEQREVDLILTDIRMPVMDGMELIRKVRRDHLDIPIVVMSSFSDEKTILQALREGANNFLRKPTNIHEFERVILPILHNLEQKKAHAFDAQSIRQLSGELSLNNEISLISGTVEYLLQPLQSGPFAPRMHSLKIALYETLINAIEHGNLEITQEEKEATLKNNRFNHLYQERFRNPVFRNRQILIRYEYQPHHVSFTIQDEGKGFNWAAQANSPTSLFSKSGRGIALTRIYVDEMIYNEKGNQVMLMLRDEEKEECRLNLKRPPFKELLPRILVVDDSLPTLKIINALLKKLGYISESANGPDQLFFLLENKEFQLILLDVFMPKTDGLTLLKRLKAHPLYQYIPVIILTSEIDEQLMADCFASGAEDFINKPVSRLLLKSRIQSVLSQHESFNQLIGMNNKLTRLNLDLHRQYEIISKTKSTLMEQHDQIQEDLLLSAITQKSTLPPLPDLPFLEARVIYRPYSTVSGDIYDFSSDHEGGLNVFLGDATGHGLAAALLTMMVHMGLKNIPQNQSSSERLRGLNGMLSHVVPRRNHITGIHLKISPQGILSGSSAGNPPCLILSATNKEVILFTDGGQALGMFTEERERYCEENSPLQQGDKLILFTDGILEWRNPKHEALGMQRIINCLDQNRNQDLSQLLDTLMTAAITFTQGLPCMDDITIVGLQYLGKSASTNV